MKQTLKRHAVLPSKAKPVPTAQTAPTVASTACRWSTPDPAAFTVKKPVEAPVAKRDTLDSRMVAELAKIAGNKK